MTVPTQPVPQPWAETALNPLFRNPVEREWLLGLARQAEVAPDSVHADLARRLFARLTRKARSRSTSRDHSI